MSDETQNLAKARKFIEEKRYEDARAILLTLDHPTADKWLARLNQIPAAAPAQPVQPTRVEVVNVASNESFTGKLVLTIVLLFILIVPGIFAIAVFGKEARAAQEKSSVVIPGAKELIFLNRYLFVLIIIGLVLFVLMFAPFLLNYYL